MTSSKQIDNLLLEQTLLERSKTLFAGEEDHYRIWQAQGSPYSYKVMAYMNYRGIKYKKIKSTLTDLQWVDKVAGQSIVPVMLTPDDRVMQDSTPIIEYLESAHEGPETIPDDNALAFVMWLIEDFCDEYMPRMHMHTRWGNALNRSALSHRIARGICYASPDVHTKDLAPMIENRQTGFNKHLGLTSESIRESVDRQISELLAILEEHFTQYQFLLGNRPSIADFALYGPLKVHFYSDPYSNEIMETEAPQTCNWIETIDDLGDVRGCAGQTEFGNWLDYSELPDSLNKLVRFIAKTYLPLAKHCAISSEKREKQYSAVIDGHTATFSTHHYRGWAFEQMQLRYTHLTASTKDQLNDLLSSNGIMPDLISDGLFHNGLFDGFTPPFIENGIPDARIKRIKEKQASASA